MMVCLLAVHLKCGVTQVSQVYGDFGADKPED